MMIHIHIEADRCRKWLSRLAEQIRSLPGANARLMVVEPGAPLNTSLKSLLTLERMLTRRNRPCGSDPCSPLETGLERAGSEMPDIILDLTVAGVNRSGKARILRPRYNGAAGEEALAGFLLAKGTPDITIEEVETGRLVACGSASLEAANGLGGGMEAVYSRVTTLLTRVLAGIEEGIELPEAETIPSISNSAALKHAMRNVGFAAIHEIYNLCCHTPHWRIGWRNAPSDDVWNRLNLGGGAWNILPHPVDHMYADPFAITWRGKDYIFFEELDHKVGKGFISVVSIDADGVSSPAVPVLEEPWHLSYPFLIEHEGEIWMIPESSLNKEVALYRAVDFPHKWEKHQTLLSNIEAADATIVQHDGAWWMFAVTREGWGGYSDTLCLYKADNLFGPWRPHPKNPVLVNEKTARPAGNMISRHGKLWRPVQDCARGYGTALGLAEVTRLDDDAFKQQVKKVLYPGSQEWPGRKLHTLNRSDRLEVIDGCIYRPKMKPFAAMVDKYYRPADDSAIEKTASEEKYLVQKTSQSIAPIRD